MKFYVLLPCWPARLRHRWNCAFLYFERPTRDSSASAARNRGSGSQEEVKEESQPVHVPGYLKLLLLWLWLLSLMIYIYIYIHIYCSSCYCILKWGSVVSMFNLFHCCCSVLICVLAIYGTIPRIIKGRGKNTFGKTVTMLRGDTESSNLQKLLINILLCSVRSDF